MLAQTAAPASTWIIVAVVAVLVVLAVAAIAARKRRTEALRERFGPEYERTVHEAGSQQRGEADLAARERAYRKLDIRPLAAASRERYAATWRGVQAAFVDDPSGAVTDADRLVNEVMRERGYPVDEPGRRMNDLSVEHAPVLDNYRTATGIAERNTHGEATTEELRTAMISYRALFNDLLGSEPPSGEAGTVEGRIVEPRSNQAARGVST